MRPAVAAATVAGLVALTLAFSRQLTTAIGRQPESDIRALAQKVTREYFPQVDPAMVVRIAWIESNFAPNAFRWEWHLADASVGVMQTLVGTATWLFEQMGATAKGEPTFVSLTDPETSIYFGAAYLNWLRTWRGKPRSEEWIVRAYNGGPGNATSQRTAAYWQKYLAAKERFG